MKAVLYFVTVCLVVVQAEEIIDLICQSDDDCAPYSTSAINSRCFQKHCICEEQPGGNRTKCKPIVNKASNRIGGQCPCVSANSYCNEKTQLCVCKEGFLASRETKKCIRKSVPLGEVCEIDEQCISSDHFSQCEDERKHCTCANNFIEYNGTCRGLIEITGKPCAKDEDCHKQAEHSLCHEAQCICAKSFVVNGEKSACLPVVRYSENCTDSNQCIAMMGVGSVCHDGKCVCNEQHFLFQEDAPSTKTTEHKIIQTCKRKISHGTSCNEDKECYQFHRGPHEQTMECFMNECVCSHDYYEKNGICVKASSATGLFVSFSVLLLTVVLLKTLV